MNFEVTMSRASRLIKQLNRILDRQKSFGENPEDFLSEIFIKIEPEIKKMKEKSKPEYWEEIYVERDRAKVKQIILNMVMSSGSEG